MSFADTLKAKAKASGKKVIQGEIPGGKSATPVTKAGKVTKKGFADALKKAKATPAQPKASIKGKRAVFAIPDVFSDNFETEMLATWSFSGLKGFEQCQWRTKLHKVDGITQESGEAANRGTYFHEQIEDWVRGATQDLPHDARSKMEAFYDQLAELKVAFDAGHATLEEKWGIRKDWSPCTWKDKEIWGKGALDGFVIEAHGLRDGEDITFNTRDVLIFTDAEGEEHTLSAYWLKNPDITKRIQLGCRIIDHKTGRKFGNEMKHADQGLCYALHAMHRFPEIETFTTEFWYLDQGVSTIRGFNRKQLGMLLTRYHNRARKMTQTVDFIPAPTVYNCQYCSYGANTNKQGKPYGNGACGFDKYRGLDDD